MDNPGFYAILPASVRYDNRLKAAEKIFYSEITALANQQGYCYAGNGYFSQLYGVDERTVKRWIKHLKDVGYICVEYVRVDSDLQRRISHSPDAPEAQRGVTKMSPGVTLCHSVTKMSRPPGQKCPPPRDKIVPQNITRIIIQERIIRAAGGRARARESVTDILSTAFPEDARLTAALLSFAESRAAGKHPLTANAAKLACSKLNQLADEAGVRDRSGYMAARAGAEHPARLGGAVRPEG